MRLFEGIININNESITRFLITSVITQFQLLIKLVEMQHTEFSICVYVGWMLKYRGT